MLMSDMIMRGEAGLRSEAELRSTSSTTGCVP